MQIKNGWEVNDRISGLHIKAVEGKGLDHLHITSLPVPDRPTMNRDFYFTKDGEYDGSGSEVGECRAPGTTAEKEVSTNKT